MSLTHKQIKALNFIIQYQDENDGVTPTYREITAHLGGTSPAPAFKIVEQLAAKGWIEKNGDGRWRSIAVLKRPSRRSAFSGRVVVTNAVPENEIWVRDPRALNLKTA